MIYLGNYHCDIFGNPPEKDIQTFYEKQKKRYSRLMAFKIADILISNPSIKVRREGNIPAIEREKIGDLKLMDHQNQNLGDLDVCVYDSRTNTILIVECKYFKPSEHVGGWVKRDHEMLNSRDIVKIERRLRWVQENKTSVAEWLGVNTPPDNLDVRCIILTARPLMIEELPSNIDLLCYGELKEQYA